MVPAHGMNQVEGNALFEPIIAIRRLKVGEALVAVQGHDGERSDQVLSPNSPSYLWIHHAAILRLLENCAACSASRRFSGETEFGFQCNFRQSRFTRSASTLVTVASSQGAVLIPVGHVSRTPAQLYGADIVSSCTVETWPERSSSGRRITRCRIINDGADLPDGSYIVEFAGHTVSTYRLLGRFELSFVNFDVSLDQAA